MRVINYMNGVIGLSKNIFIVAAVSVGALLLSAGFFLFRVQAQSLNYSASSTQSNTAGTVYLSPDAKKDAPVVSKNSPIQGVNIANSGFTMLSGARVIAVAGTQIRVHVEWGAVDFTWEVATDAGTKFFTSKGEKATLADIRTGDVITVSGDLVETNGEPTISATFVRESH